MRGVVLLGALEADRVDEQRPRLVWAAIEHGHMALGLNASYFVILKLASAGKPKDTNEK